MSVHFNEPYVYTACQVKEILSDAKREDVDIKSLGSIISFDEFKAIKDKTQSKLEEIVISLRYNSHMVKLSSGREVPTCTRTFIELYKLDNKFYYPITRHHDYGDEGEYETVKFICSPVELIDKNKQLFDEIKQRVV